MGIFGPSARERHAAAAAAIAPYGFVIDRDRARALREFQPFALHATPESYEVAAFGRIEDAGVGVFEYGYSSTDSENNTSHYTQMVAVVTHPQLVGGAALRPDWPEWGGLAAFLDAVLWVPPFTIVKAVVLLANMADPDRKVGHAEFDRLYRVRAANDEAAGRAISPQLRDLLPRIGFRGTLELRDGALLFSLPECSFDHEGVMRLLGHVAPLLAATAHARQYPLR